MGMKIVHGGKELTVPPIIASASPKIIEEWVRGDEKKRTKLESDRAETEVQRITGSVASPPPTKGGGE